MLGIANADSAENRTPGTVHVITPLLCAAPHRRPDNPLMVGLNEVRVLTGTRLAEFMGAGAHHEGFFCNYGLSVDFRARFEASGAVFSAFDAGGEIRASELPAHPFFVATLFQPQLTSQSTGRPHPLIVAYLRAVAHTRSLAGISTRTEGANVR